MDANAYKGFRYLTEGEMKPGFSFVSPLGGRVADLEQGFRLGAADRLMLDRRRSQDARAPGGLIGVKRAGKMDTAVGCRAFAGDHAIAHDCQRMSGGVAARRLKRGLKRRFKDVDCFDAIG